MQASDSDRTPPSPTRDWALFLDVDGTLTHHVDRPDAVRVGDGVRETLLHLMDVLDGAVALVTGRSMASLDALFFPLQMTHVAGLHGIEYRPHLVSVADADASSDDLLARFASEAREIAERHDGAVIEAHGPCLYLHWRAAPAAREPLAELAQRVARDMKTHRLHPGAHGIEIRPHGMDKGRAIKRFMEHAPFKGRVPVFAGDDPADEPGFEVVNQMGGISVSVGDRPGSAARFALRDAAAVLQWLTAGAAVGINQGEAAWADCL